MNINLSLTIEQTNVILKSLAELPFRESADLINSIRMQAQQSIQAQQAIQDSPTKMSAPAEEVVSTEE